MSSPTPKIIFGSALLGQTTVEETKTSLALLEELGIEAIDTAMIYGDSEKFLGEANAAEHFTLDTKIAPNPAQEQTEEVVANAIAESLKKLKTKSVNIFYLHAPDRRVSFEVPLRAINEAYKNGSIKRFGLSNFLAREIEEVVRICKENGFILPSVYQGNYSAVARLCENDIFPAIRKHNIAFYAYSPIAGGFLAKSKEQFTSGNLDGRWDPKKDIGALYGGLYGSPAYIDALGVWEEVAAEEGISRVELAFRWIANHSKLQAEYGDGIIFGASKESQFKNTVEWIKKGPVSQKAVDKIEGMWKSLEKHAILDNFNSGMSDMMGLPKPAN